MSVASAAVSQSPCSPGQGSRCRERRPLEEKRLRVSGIRMLVRAFKVLGLQGWLKRETLVGRDLKNEPLVLKVQTQWCADQNTQIIRPRSRNETKVPPNEEPRSKQTLQLLHRWLNPCRLSIFPGGTLRPPPLRPCCTALRRNSTKQTALLPAR